MPLYKRNPLVLCKTSGAAQSFTGTLTETVLATISLPAGIMTLNGALVFTTLWSFTNSANNKTLRARLGGVSGSAVLQAVTTTQAFANIQRTVINRNSASSQSTIQLNNTNSFFSGTAAIVTTSVDTSVAVDLVFTGQLADSTETITLETYLVQVMNNDG